MSDLLGWLRENFPDSKITLQDNGRYVLMNSPMRYDRTPSLMVWTDKGNWRDLGGNHEEGFLDELCERTGKDVPKIDGAPARKRTDEEKDEADARKTKRAAQEWNSASPATSEHKYLKAKGITDTFGLRVNRKGQLVIPGVDLRTDEFRMIQTVDDHLNAEGKWHKNDTGPATFSGWYVGGERGDEHSSLVLAEGPATAASVKAMFPEMAVVCTFGSENIGADYDILRKRFPSREIIVASDSGTEELVSKLMGALPVIPSAARTNFDWNDCVAELGQEEARRQFMQKLESARKKASSPLPKRKGWSEKANVLNGKDSKPIKRLFGLFPAGQVSLLAGMSGTGKSLLLQCLAQAGADGSGAFGQETPLKTLFIEGDGDRAVFGNRAAAFAWEPKSGVQWLFTMEHADDDFSTQTADGVRTLNAIAEELKPDLLVIDSISGVDGILDELDTAQMKNAFKVYRNLASEHGIAVICVHHLRKRPTQFIDRPVSLHDIAGSAAAQRFCHSIFGMWTETGEGTKQVITASLKDWGEAPEPFSYTIRTAESGCKELLFKFHGVEVHEEKDSKQGKVIDAIRSFGAEEFSREDVEERSGASGATVRRILGKYADSKDLLRIAHGRETKYKRSPFSRVFCSLSSSTLFFEQEEARGQSQTESILLMGDEQYKSDEQHEQKAESYCSNDMSSIDRSSVRADGTFCSKLVHEQHDEQHEQKKIPAVETPKPEQGFSSRGANVPLPLVEEAEAFPSEMELPHLWRSKNRWIVAIQSLGDGSRSFGLSQVKDGKPRVWLREPRAEKAA